jgi:hypothetical protein
MNFLFTNCKKGYHITEAAFFRIAMLIF